MVRSGPLNHRTKPFFQLQIIFLKHEKSSCFRSDPVLCVFCRGRQEMLCGTCNGAGFVGGFLSGFDN